MNDEFTDFDARIQAALNERELPSHQMFCPKCHQVITKKRVHGETPNKGRPYAACKPCGVFLWLDNGKCGCGCFWQKHQVKKEGRNQGKWFRTCPGCEAFQWIGGK